MKSLKSLKLLVTFICISFFIGVLALTTDYFAGISLWHVYTLMGIDMMVFYVTFPYFKAERSKTNDTHSYQGCESLKAV